MSEEISSSERRAMLAEAIRLQDFKDLQYELSGLDTGRIKRFLTQDQHDSRDPEKRVQERYKAYSRLIQRLLNDRFYAALYHNTLSQLQDAEDATERAIHQLETRLEQEEQELEELLDKSAVLPDGTRIFRDKNNQVRNEHGDIIESLTADQIVWRGDEPSYEAYVAQKQTVREIENKLHEVQTYQVDVLGTIRDRISDENHPPSQEELEQFQKDIKSQMPASVKLHLEPETAIKIEPENSSSVQIPKL